MKIKKWLISLKYTVCSLVCASSLIADAAVASKYSLPPQGACLFGKMQFAIVKKDDTLASIARRYDMGYFEVAAANPQVDSDKPQVDTAVIIPSRQVLPDIPHKDIVINLATMRMYYFPHGKKYFYSFPVGIGKFNWSSPLGNFHIIEKIKNPVWIVPDSIYNFRKLHGDPVPHTVKSGPDNPLGYYALRLSQPTYLIHGTNEPDSVGKRSSAGCIHLYAKDIVALYQMVKVGTHVLIINQPYAVVWHNKHLILEAHLPLKEQRRKFADTQKVLTQLIKTKLEINKRVSNFVDLQKAIAVINEHTGIPTVISKFPIPRSYQTHS